MKLTIFSAMGLGVLFAALLLIWEEVSITTRGISSEASTFWFTAFSLLAIAIYSVAVLAAPDNAD
ncbi:MAG: hypothetical protein QXX17_01930 [Conexivisphaerales archaeon]